MWEYKRKDYKFSLYHELIEALNIEGNDNWEVVFYSEERPEKFGREFQARVLFKRLKLE